MVKRLLPVILLVCIMAVPAHASVFQNKSFWHMETYDDVFWCNLHCDEVSIDLAVPPPNYDIWTDPNVDRRNVIGYEDCWYGYFRTEQPNLHWKNVPFCVNDEPPNYSQWDLDDTISAWSLYFNEMYYDGGPNYSLDEREFSIFWDDLFYEGEPVDPFSAPPNYDADLDYWRSMRSEIGYAWYWEYYLGGQINYVTQEVADLSWRGIAFNGHDSSPNYDRDADPYYFSRIRRGHLDWWARYFVETYAPTT